MNEFFSQGDLEKKLGLPVSMNCDRDKVLVPCPDWIREVCNQRPLRIAFPNSSFGGNYLLGNFENNHKKWQEIEEEVKAGGQPYTVKFDPPTEEGGWLGVSN